MAAGFFMSGSILYKRNHDMTLMRCVDAKEANHMIEEGHEGSFGTHANGQKDPESRLLLAHHGK